MSTPQKGSKRQAIRRGLERVKQAIKPSSHLSPPDPGSTAGLSIGGRSTSPAPSATSGQSTTTQPGLSETSGAAGEPTQSSTSGANPAPTTASTSVSPEPSTGTRLRQAGGATLTGLETALRILEESARVLPPLKSAVSGLIDCLDIVQTAARNDQDYEALTLELTTMAGTLKQYLTNLGLEDPSGSATRIALSVEAEVAHIAKQQGRGKGRRIIESTEDREDIIKCYHRIEGLFRQLQGDMGLRVWISTNEQHMTSLLRGMSPVDEARYNSSYSTTIKRRGCTKETREKVQEGLQDWARDPNAAQVYWMNGMAGTGKTTIAYSLCEWLEANQQLGASFFCSRASSSCRNVNGIVPTIAYQLARYCPAFQSELCKVLKAEPDASKLNVVQQFEKLVRAPMLAGKTAVPEGVVVVIDALDECDDDDGLRLILRVVLRLAAGLPLKFFVTSRPEPAIREGTRRISGDESPPAILHLHDIEESIVEEDIKKYLKEALSSMPTPPSDEQIAQLAKRAGKLFIYAATLVRYILPSRGTGNSLVRLNAILATDSNSSSKETSTKRYKQLDELYTTVLTAAFGDEELENDEIEAMRLVLRAAVCVKEPLTAFTMASLLDLTEDKVLSVVRPLRSVLHVSKSSGLISTLHASFTDYILDPLRSGDFYCDSARYNEYIAGRCFDIMERQLRFNICGLESSFTFDGDLPDLEQRVENCISPTLFYTCCYWGEHLRQAATSDVLCNRLSSFLAQKLLFWMEVLNLKRRIVKGMHLLIQAEDWLMATGASREADKLVVDARDFVSRFAAGACSRSTPHIYISALPFCAKSSSVYARYWGHTRGLMDVKGSAISWRDKSALATWVTDSTILTLGFSPDGTRIVSGFYDGKLRVWDARTGETVAGPFEGHALSVDSVMFSPDGTRIVSGSGDGSIRVWDAHTGDIIAVPVKASEESPSVGSVGFSPDGSRIVSSNSDRVIQVWDAHTGISIAGPFTGHTKMIHSVAFSPDGMRIVSCSDDRTIRVWDARTGATVAGPFEHESFVRSAALSPDGTRIASGCDDQTIRVLDAYTGEILVGPFHGHSSVVTSITFSPGGTRIASGSGYGDCTIRVWDTCTGSSVAGPFIGHTGSVNSIAFSPDGTRIVSGSDRTVRVWDSRTASGLLEGHKKGITSVAFSTDGSSIISGSYDMTIRVWDVCTGDALTGPFIGHTGWVNSVAVSPDGSRIVSGSFDRTIRVWDICTGNTVAGPFDRHTSSVTSVAFSPDGISIVSGSDDRTLLLWDARTGDPIAGPFKGHQASIRTVAFSPNGTHIVSGSDDRTIRLWDARTGDTITGPFSGRTSFVKAVAFSPDGTRIVSGSDNRTVQLWDARTGDMITEPFEGHTGAVISVAFAPDGKYIVSGSDDRTIRVWDAATGYTVIGPLRGHTSSVYSAVFSPDGTHIASASLTIRVWDARPCDTVIRPFEGRAGLSNSVASSDNTSILPDPETGHNNVRVRPTSNPAHLDYTHHTSVEIHDFEVNSDGWVTTNDILLFWIPPDFSAYLPHPRNTLLVGPQGTSFVDYRHLALGEKWSECYISQ